MFMNSCNNDWKEDYSKRLTREVQEIEIRGNTLNKDNGPKLSETGGHS